MAYVLGNLGMKLGPGEHSAAEVAAAEGRYIASGETLPTTVVYGTCYPPSTMPGAQPQRIPEGRPCPPNFTRTPPPPTIPTTPSGLRPWPGAGGTVMTRPCYPSSTLAMLGAQPQQIPVNQACPANFTPTPPGTAFGTSTSGIGNIAGSTPTIGRTIGTNIGQRYTSTGFTKPPQRIDEKPPRGVSITRPTVQPTTPTPSEPVPSEPVPTPYPEEAPAGAVAAEPFFSKYKWWIVGGSVVLVAIGTGAYFLLRKKAAPVTAYIPIYKEAD